MKIDGLKSLPISLKELSKAFEDRHEFNTEELSVLQGNFPNVNFLDIPDAWIILIDKMLREVHKDVKSVEQHYGLLCVSEKVSGELDLSIISAYEKKLYKIDKDLHDRLQML